MRSRFRGFEFSVLLLTGASVAFGQTAPSTQAAPSASPVDSAPAPAVAEAPASAGDPATLEAARELFWKAHSYFEKGEYVEALRLFEQTYALRQEPEVLFNLALTHQRLGHCDKARTLYQEYQARVRADVTKQLGQLDQQCPAAPPAPLATEAVPAPFSVTVVQPPEPREDEPAPAPPAAPVDVAESQPFPMATLGWVAVGAAAVALGAAVYFEAERRQYSSEYTDKASDPEDPNLPDNTGDQLDELEDDHDRAQTLAVTLGVASGVLAAGGVTLLVLAPSAPEHAESERSKLGLGLRWSGSF